MDDASWGLVQTVALFDEKRRAELAATLSTLKPARVQFTRYTVGRALTNIQLPEELANRIVRESVDAHAGGSFVSQMCALHQIPGVVPASVSIVAHDHLPTYTGIEDILTMIPADAAYIVLAIIAFSVHDYKFHPEKYLRALIIANELDAAAPNEVRDNLYLRITNSLANGSFCRQLRRIAEVCPRFERYQYTAGVGVPGGTLSEAGLRTVIKETKMFTD